MLEIAGLYSWNIVFVAVNIQIIVSLIPYLIIKKRPDLNADFKKFKASEIGVTIVYILTFLISLIFKNPLIFTISSIVAIVINIIAIIMMVYHYLQEKNTNTL